MAYGFTKTIPIITGSHANFPVMLRAFDFPTAAIDGGAASILNGGGNLRAYTDSSKATRLPVHVIRFVTGGVPDVLVRVLVPSAYTGATVYIEADAVETTQPAVANAFGRNAANAGYRATLNMEENPAGASPQMTDATGNGYDGTSAGSMTLSDSVAARLGNGLDFDGVDDAVLVGSNFGAATTTVLGVLFRTTVGGGALIGQQNTVFPTVPTNWVPCLAVTSVGQLRAELWAGTNGGIVTASAVTDGQWHMAIVEGSGSSQRLYMDGTLIGSRTGTLNQSWWTHSSIGVGYDVSSQRGIGSGWCEFLGIIGHVYVSSTIRSADWYAAEWSNIGATSSWGTNSAWVDSGGGVADLSGSATGQASASAALTTRIPLAGAAVTVVAATGAVTTAIPFAGAAAVVASAAGQLTTSIKLDGAALAAALASAGLSTAIPLIGSAPGQSSASGGLSGAAQFDGNAIAQALATGQLTIQIRLAGDAIAQALATGALTAGGAGALAGAAQSVSAASGALITQIPLAGAALSVTAVSGGLTTIIPLTGAAASVATAIGSLDVALTLGGAANAQALANGTLTAFIRFNGAAVAQAAASGALNAAAAAATPDWRTLRVQAEQRLLRVDAETRTLRVVA